MLPLEWIRLDGGTQSRAELRQETIDDLYEDGILGTVCRDTPGFHSPKECAA